mmetsp:Transcript_19817/g.54675  ORF Transcript_19817/g.54675 Transcript_19817/m.54675 type:complete len:234 (+) Transcript_19817:2985-3686(+)
MQLSHNGLRAQRQADAQGFPAGVPVRRSDALRAERTLAQRPRLQLHIQRVEITFAEGRFNGQLLPILNTRWPRRVDNIGNQCLETHVTKRFSHRCKSTKNTTVATAHRIVPCAARRGCSSRMVGGIHERPSDFEQDVCQRHALPARGQRRDTCGIRVSWQGAGGSVTPNAASATPPAAARFATALFSPTTRTPVLVVAQGFRWRKRDGKLVNYMRSLGPLAASQARAPFILAL